MSSCCVQQLTVLPVIKGLRPFRLQSMIRLTLAGSAVQYLSKYYVDTAVMSLYHNLCMYANMEITLADRQHVRLWYQQVHY
jgi:hypothetical protein